MSTLVAAAEPHAPPAPQPARPVAGPAVGPAPRPPDAAADDDGGDAFDMRALAALLDEPQRTNAALRKYGVPAPLDPCASRLSAARGRARSIQDAFERARRRRV